MRVSVISGGRREEFRRVSVANQGGGVRTIRVIDARPREDDADDPVLVRLVRPGHGVVGRLRVSQAGGGWRRREHSSMLRPLERGIRRLARREVEIASDYLARHHRSNSRERNGWLVDLRRNVSRALKSGR